MSHLDMSRRDFLRLSAVATTAAAAAACARAPAPTATPTEAPAATPEPTEAVEEKATEAPTEAPAAKYNEAPMLAEKVAAGELPPVEERLPKNPLVLEPLDEIGQYCGTWHRANTYADGASGRRGQQPLVTYARDARTIEPNIAWKWDVNEDSTEFTFYIREGIKWSDGEPYTADDIMFWYEDVLLNEELTPSIPKWVSPGGEPVVVEKIDDYTTYDPRWKNQ